jgi:putative transposase
MSYWRIIRNPKIWWVKVESSSSSLKRWLSAVWQPKHLKEEPIEESKPKNRRNGHSKKTIKGEFGEAEIAVPHDRNSEFEPLIVKKGQTRFNGFDDKILSLYARGMTTRDIQAQLLELYSAEVSHTLISNVTNAVEEERKAWQNRILDEVYPIMFLDALVVKIRQEGRVINKAIHMALGVNMEGKKELLGLRATHDSEETSEYV